MRSTLAVVFLSLFPALPSPAGTAEAAEAAFAEALAQHPDNRPARRGLEAARAARAAAQ